MEEGGLRGTKLRPSGYQGVAVKQEWNYAIQLPAFLFLVERTNHGGGHRRFIIYRNHCESIECQRGEGRREEKEGGGRRREEEIMQQWLTINSQ